ncbi:hypothetical protein GCT13_11895 [Paraburkholderia sp. CNPSo 3157]|uniref:DUF2782 domain-containing protein n=1 Tax=Paraburkholderia franconis TaxID=2654983 RepID=A0A7X1N9A4_9BURK|nr:hypothetical protein [Paraburkholderia franconis]MPW17614.1 hypothetical protein [Paraburkholderia franconis]
MMKPLRLIANTALCAACLYAVWPAAAQEVASVVNSAAVARPGGLTVTQNLQVYGTKPPMPKPGGKVTPPDKPPVVSVISPGMPDKDKNDSEKGHGQRNGQNLRQFSRADGTFVRQ